MRHVAAISTGGAGLLEHRAPLLALDAALGAQPEVLAWRGEMTTWRVRIWHPLRRRSAVTDTLALGAQSRGKDSPGEGR